MERTQPGTGNAVVRRMKAAFTWGARESSAASVSSAPAQDAHAQYGVPQGTSEAGISRDSSLQHCPASSAYPAAAGATATEMINKHTRTSEGPRKNMSHYKAARRVSQRRIWSCRGIHGIVPGGGLTANGRKWKSCKNDFFVHVKVMSKLFRGKFLAYLKKLRAENKLVYPGAVSQLASPGAFNHLISKLYKKKWVVYCKPPFEKTENVLEYLGRYTHRIALSNHRLVKLENDEVSFRWRDYADNNKTKIMPLKADEFIRRFLLHVLPDRFVKIRHYGLLGNRCRKKKLDRCRELLACADQNEAEQNPEQKTETWQEALLRLTGLDIAKCPKCGERAMRTVETLLPARCKGPPRV